MKKKTRVIVNVVAAIAMLGGFCACFVFLGLSQLKRESHWTYGIIASWLAFAGGLLTLLFVNRSLFASIIKLPDGYDSEYLDMKRPILFRSFRFEFGLPCQLFEPALAAAAQRLDIYMQLRNNRLTLAKVAMFAGARYMRGQGSFNATIHDEGNSTVVTGYFGLPKRRVIFMLCTLGVFVVMAWNMANLTVLLKFFVPWVILVLLASHIASVLPYRRQNNAVLAMLDDLARRHNSENLTSTTTVL